MNTLVQQCDKAVLEDAVVAMGWFLQLRRDGGDTLAEGQTIEIRWDIENIRRAIFVALTTFQRTLMLQQDRERRNFPVMLGAGLVEGGSEHYAVPEQVQKRQVEVTSTSSGNGRRPDANMHGALVNWCRYVGAGGIIFGTRESEEPAGMAGGYFQVWIPRTVTAFAMRQLCSDISRCQRLRCQVDTVAQQREGELLPSWAHDLSE
jgi:hypothetical protein